MKRILTRITNMMNKLKNGLQNINLRKFRMIVITIFLVCFSAVILSTSMFIYQFKSRMDKMIIPNALFETVLAEITTESSTPPLQTVENIPPAQEQTDAMSEFYFLVMGLDYREGHRALLTDSLMLMHVIPQESIIRLLSIPRDLMVENRSGNIVKINSLFYEGYLLSQKKTTENPSLLTGEVVRFGPFKLDKTVIGGAMANTRHKIEQLLDIHIDHMLLVNFESFVTLVDAVGGVEIDVKRSMRYGDNILNVEPGRQLLSGTEALGYARFRVDNRGKGYHISDFERGQNQQELVKALVDKILSWKSISQALKLLDIVSDNVKTDLNYSDMYSMIKNYYRVFNVQSFRSIQFPEYYSPNGDVIIPDDALLQLRVTLRSY